MSDIQKVNTKFVFKAIVEKEIVLLLENYYIKYYSIFRKLYVFLDIRKPQKQTTAKQ